MGAALVCSPFLSSAVLATSAIQNCGSDDDLSELLPGLAAGESIATLAVAEENGSWNLKDLRLQADGYGSERFLTGTKLFVLDGHVADIVLVAARTQVGISLLSVSSDADGLTRHLLPTIDPTRKLAKLEFRNTPGRILGQEGEAADALEHALALGAIGLAAEQVGGATRVLEIAVEYAKQRVQFGKPIGSFQAIKHKCADLLVEIESARSAVYYAMWAATEQSPDVLLAASLAKALSSDAYSHVAAANIQIHGGIGFTWEHSAHLFFRRAKSSELLLGDASHHLGLVAGHIGL
jgi:alkylation response protein AidB-like acyl-CoA dehydrogenase